MMIMTSDTKVLNVDFLVSFVSRELTRGAVVIAYDTDNFEYQLSKQSNLKMAEKEIADFFEAYRKGEPTFSFQDCRER